MHNDSADSIAIGTVKGSYTKTDQGFVNTMPEVDPNYMLSNRALSIINPTSPIDYHRNTTPVVTQTENGDTITAIPNMSQNEPYYINGVKYVNGYPQSGQIVQADLPQDQIAYKNGATPLKIIGGYFKPKQSEGATVEKVSAPVETDSKTLFIVTAVLIIIAIIFAKW